MIRRAKIILALALGWAALAVSAQTAAPFPNLPLYFEANQGSADGAFPFLARGRTSRFLIAPAEARFVLRRADGASATVRMQFVGANQQAPIRGDGELPGKINYLVGNNPEQWRTAVPAFTRLRVPEVYPGITLVYYGNQQQLEYDFTVAPGADPDAMRIHFEGVEKVVISPQGDLVLALPDGEIRQAKPMVYQMVAGARADISGGYRLVDAHTVTFTVGRYDRSLPLVIDPVLSYATYFGGNHGDAAFSVKVDANGFVYIAGETLSTQFPASIAPNDNQTNFNGGSFNGGQFSGDAFVAKLGNYGSNFVYLTYLGGSADDGALDVAVDGSGHAFVTGFTDSTNFPVWPTNLINHAFQTRIGGTNTSFPLQTLGYNNDAFVTELSADGSGLVYSSYLGGNDIDYGTAIAVDAAGNAYVTGITDSTNFPSTNTFNPPHPYQRFLQSSNYFLNGNAFITEIAAGGTQVLYSTYLGGTNYDSGEGIAVDTNSGDIYVSGVTDSTNFPLKNPLFPYLNGFTNGSPNQTFAFDGFVAKFSTNFGSLVYSTYLGSTNYDAASRIRCDSLGDAYVVGSTASTNFPNLLGANFIASYVTNNVNFFPITTNAFVVEINPNGSAILNSVVFGGNQMDLGYDLALDANNNIFVVGSTTSTNFPAVNTMLGYLRATNSGNSDVFVTAFGANFSSVLYSTCLGGNNQDFGYGMAVDTMTNAYVVGQTLSTNFPAPNGLLTTLDGTNDAFLAVIQYILQPVQITSQPVGVTNGTGSSVSFSVSVTGTPPFFYQWQMTNATTLNTNGVLTWMNLTNGGIISGATNATLTINPATITNSGTYQVIVTNYAFGGLIVTSSPAVLLVTNSPVLITQQPVSQTNGVGATVAFAVNGTGTPPIFFQWLKDGNSLTNGKSISGSILFGVTNALLIITNVQTADAGNYSVLVSNSVNAVTSSNATLTVYASPTITQEPVGGTNGTGSPVLLTATAFGTLPLHYHWQFQAMNQVIWTNLSNGGVISGATTNQLLISSASTTNTGNYQLVVTNIVGSVTSSVALVVVTNFPVIITLPPVSQTNGVGATVSFTVANSGTPPFFYHWQLNGTNLANGATGSGSVISGVTNSVLTLTSIHTNDLGNYSVTVSNSVNAVTSSSATLTVYAFPTITQQPAGETVGAGATVTLAATAFGTVPLHYRWQVQATNQNTWANLANVGNVSGATTNTLNISNAASTNTANYQLVVTNIVGSVTSSVALVVVTNFPVVITQQPVNQTVAVSNTATFSVSETGTPPVSVHWLENGVGLTNGAGLGGSIISGATNLVLTTSTNLTLTIRNAQATNDGNYSVILSNLVNSVTSSNASLAVVAFPTIYVEPTNQTVVSGTPVSLVTAAAGEGTLYYRWLVEPPGQTNFINVATNALISDVTNPVLNIYAVISGFFGPSTNGATSTNSGSYQLIVTNYLGSVTSSVAVITVTNTPIILTSQPASQTNGVGSTIEFIVNGTATEPYLQWLENGTNVLNGTNASGSIFSGANSDPLVINNAQTNDSGIYALVVSNTANMVTSSNAILLITAAPIIIAEPASQTNGGGGTANFNVTAVGETNLVYQWAFNGTNLTDGGRISGSATSSLAITNLQAGDAGGYLVVVTNLFGSATSTVATLTVALAPTITVEPTNQTVGLGATVDFSVTAVGEAPLVYGWQSNAVSLTEGGRISGSTNSILTIAGTLTNDNGGGYSVIITNIFGAVTSSPPAFLTVLALPQFVSITAQGSTNFTLSGVGGTNGGLYYILTSSNLAIPLSSWTLEGSNNFGSQGQFNLSFTNTFPQQFFILQITN